VIDPADLPRFAQLDVIASVEPARLADRAMAETRLAPARQAQVWPFRSLADSGAPLAFGSTDPMPFADLAMAMTRQDKSGQPAGGWQPGQNLSRNSALAAATSGAAYGMGADGRFGSLEIGEWADFLFVTVDPLLAAPEQLRQGQVLETWIAGHKVWSAESGQVLPTGAAIGR